jgi:hypothetical protein
MSSQLKVTIEQKAKGGYIIYPWGSLNRNTFQIFEELDEYLDAMQKKVTRGAGL